MEKTFILGLGTGRCGTVSLASLLSAQDDSDISHELSPNLDWAFNLQQITKRFELITNRDSQFVGDISFYNLNYVDHISRKCQALNIPLKILHIYRDKAEVVQSYMIKTLGRNHWYLHDNTNWKRDATWDSCYPKYDIPSKVKAIARYYDDYIARCDAYVKKYNIYSLDVQELNSEMGVGKLLEFCCFTNKKVITHVRKNAIR